MRHAIVLISRSRPRAAAAAATPPSRRRPRRRPRRAAVGAGLRALGRRLRARRRPQPVRRARPGEGEPQLPRHPRVLLPGHGARQGARLQGSGPARRRPPVGQGRLGGAVLRHGRFGCGDAAPGGGDRAQARSQARRRRQADGAARPAGVLPGEGCIADAGRQGIPRRARVTSCSEGAPGHRPRRRSTPTCSASSRARCRRNGRQRRCRRRRSRRARTRSRASSRTAPSTSTPTRAARCTTASRPSRPRRLLP